MFHIWPQIEDVLKFNVTPIDLALQFHPHTLRYLLVYPCIFLADVFEIPRDIFYSLFVCCCWVGIVYLSFSILRRTNVINIYMFYIHFFITTGYVLLLMVANGRGILALFGVMLFFFIQWKEIELSLWKKVSGLIFSFLLCSVSTGVSFCFAISLLFILMINLKIEKFIWIGLFIFPILCFFSYMSFEKNIAYYGSIISMLDHGLPGMFEISALKWGVVAIILFFAYFIYHTLYKEFGNNVIILIMYVLGGLFGTLTFVAIIPSLLTAFFFHYIKNNMVTSFKNRFENII